MTTPNGGEDMNQEELSFFAGGTANDTTTLKDSLARYLFTKLSIVLPRLSNQTRSIYLNLQNPTHRCL